MAKNSTLRAWHIDQSTRLDVLVKKLGRNGKWRTELYRNGDETDIIELGRTVYGWSMDRSSWMWKYRQNPFGSPVILVTREMPSGRLIGHHAAIPIEKCFGGKRETDFMIVDSMVDEMYRRKGLYIELFWKLPNLIRREGGQVAFGLPNAQAYTATLRMEGKRIATLPVHFKPLNWPAVAERIPFLKGLVRPVTAALGPLLRRARRAPSSINGLQEIFEFDHALSQAVLSWLPDNWLSTNRTKAYLTWRYFSRPGSAYRVFLLHSEGRAAGIAVLTTIERWGLKLGIIVDLVLDPLVGLSLRRLDQLVHVFYRWEADAVVSLLGGPASYRKLFQRSGFFASELTWTERPFHLVADRFSETRDAPDSAIPDRTASPEQWFFTLGDTDLV